MVFMIIEDIPFILHAICKGLVQKLGDIEFSLFAIKCKKNKSALEEKQYDQFLRWISEQKQCSVISAKNKDELISVKIKDIDYAKTNVALDVSLFGETEEDYNNSASVEFAKHLEHLGVMNQKIIFYTLYTETEQRNEFNRVTNGQWGDPIKRPSFFTLDDDTIATREFFQIISEGRAKYENKVTRWV